MFGGKALETRVTDRIWPKNGNEGRAEHLRVPCEPKTATTVCKLGKVDEKLADNEKNPKSPPIKLVWSCLVAKQVDHVNSLF